MFLPAQATRMVPRYRSDHWLRMSSHFDGRDVLLWQHPCITSDLWPELHADCPNVLCSPVVRDISLDWDAAYGSAGPGRMLDIVAANLRRLQLSLGPGCVLHMAARQFLLARSFRLAMHRRAIVFVSAGISDQIYMITGNHMTDTSLSVYKPGFVSEPLDLCALSPALVGLYQAITLWSD